MKPKSDWISIKMKLSDTAWIGSKLYTLPVTIDSQQWQLHTFIVRYAEKITLCCCAVCRVYQETLEKAHADNHRIVMEAKAGIQAELDIPYNTITVLLIRDPVLF
jgi:hypothetical protein